MSPNQEYLKVRGARTHNLKNIDVDIPKNKLTVITGLSGSGKSSLAFDTIYAEGQRRYVESLSAYARQFLGLMEKPDVDLIEGLAPAISIDQKSSGHNPRSTVGTVTEIYDYLRLLYARVGHPRSPINGRRLKRQTVQEIVDTILNLNSKLEQKPSKNQTSSQSEIMNYLPEGELPLADELRDKQDIASQGSQLTAHSSKLETRISILAPIVKNRKGTYEELFSRFLAQGFVRVRVDEEMYNLEEDIKLDKFKKHNIELVVDRIVIKPESKDDKELVKRLTDSVELSLNLGEGEIYINIQDFDKIEQTSLIIKPNGDVFFSENLVDPETGQSFPEIEPHSFSFNSPHGACPVCNGLGNIREVDPSNIFNPRLTIMEGGIYPWNRVIENENSFTMNLLKMVSEKHNIPLRKPLNSLDSKQIDILLYGTKGENYKVNYINNEGKDRVYNSEFEGVVNWIERRYQETESDYIRNEIEQYMVEKRCPECLGYRLKKESLVVTISGKNIVDITNMSVKEAHDWINAFENLDKNYIDNQKSTLEEIFQLKNINPLEDAPTAQEMEIGKQIFKEIGMRLNFLMSVGLEYLTLSRTARTLSGGEAQRIRLASQIGTGLTGVLYVLDEPSIGLHQRDNERLIKTLERLRDIGNTVIVVEHDEDTIKKADYIVDIGPLAGEHGGQVVGQGDLDTILKNEYSLTAQYLSGKRHISTKEIQKDLIKLGVKEFRKKNKDSILVTGITHNNLKNVDLEVPLGKFVCITGVSGSGKSSMTNDVFYKILAREVNGAKDQPGNYKTHRGLEHIDKVIDIDQSPIGRTPRSNPATYTGVFTNIRDIFAQTKEAKSRGYKSGRFSFNVKGGRCEKCQGAGVNQISMQFLPDVYVTCDVCDGKRYNRETLQIDYKGKNISEVLDMTVEEGTNFFGPVPSIRTKLQTLQDVGLGYIRLGQAATTLSGGESQRVKLASELAKRSTGKTIFILDEPTTGLHFEDVRKLLVVLHSLVAKGNTVLVIEHNLDVIKTADWIIDMGPEGGESGGEIMAEGTVEDIMKTKGSYTGEWLSKINH